MLHFLFEANDKSLNAKKEATCMKSQKIPAVVKRTAFRVFVLVLTAVMLITSGMVNAQMFDRLQAMYDLAQQTFTLAPEAGVTVDLSGMMPKGGSATAVPAETEDEDVIHAYDITIRYQDGREFEPDNDEPISVSFMSDQIAEALKDDETLEVAHIPDNGEEEDVALTSAGGDTATFEAESFSVYLIRTHAGDSQNHNPRRIYHFLSPKFTTIESDGNTYYKAPEYFFPNKVNEMVSVQAIPRTRPTVCSTAGMSCRSPVPRKSWLTARQLPCIPIAGPANRRSAFRSTNRSASNRPTMRTSTSRRFTRGIAS